MELVLRPKTFFESYGVGCYAVCGQAKRRILIETYDDPTLRMCFTTNSKALRIKIEPKR